MRNPLKTLERIKKFELDEQRRQLVIEQELEDSLQKKLNDLVSAYEKEKIFVSENPGICDFGLYTEQYLKKRQKIETQIKEIQIKIEQIRDVMSDMFKEQKTYEMIDKNRRKAKQKEFEAQEQKMLDEIGTNTYIKKHPQ